MRMGVLKSKILKFYLISKLLFEYCVGGDQKMNYGSMLCHWVRK